MIKKFLTLNELLCMIQHGTQPDTIYVNNENGTDTEVHWVNIAKEYLTKDGNSLWFKLRKETLFLSRSFYYYINPLDEVEKEYLRNVIKPFRKNVCYIAKICNNDRSRIVIGYHNIDNIESMEEFKGYIKGTTKIISFPWFKNSTGMYKGMEPGRHYTLVELGL